MKITDRATPEPSGLYSMPSEGASAIRHRLPVPVGACPFSRNPIRGWIEIRYIPAGRALEVVALDRYIRWCAGGGEGAPMSAEGIAARVQADCAAALGCDVRVMLVLLVRPGPQRLVIEVG